MLYHIDVNLPTFVPRAIHRLPIRLSRHAEQRTRDKQIDLMRLKGEISGSVFEAEVIDGRIIKVAIRSRYSDTHDLCAAIASNGIIITLWLNRVTDNHRTLNTGKYAK